MPLFVEELTKAVLESEQIHEDRDRYVLEQPTRQLAIPTTLQDSLMARVDRLGSAREVLQIGAAIGREFSYELLAAVAGLPDTVLQDALVRLTEAELLFMRGTPPNVFYVFKHALVQDTAYSTMLRARRQQLHGAIASVLEKRFPEVIAATPELIAQQFEGAGRGEQAIRCWRQAGDRDLRRFALKEAIAHYSSAMRAVLNLPASIARDEHELATCLVSGAWVSAADRAQPGFERVGAPLRTCLGARPGTQRARSGALPCDMGDLVSSYVQRPHGGG